MMWIGKLLLGLPGILDGVLTYLNKKQDTALEQFRVGNTNGKEVSIAVVLAEQARINALKDVTVNAMNHPIWWAAWALGVFPVLAYHASVFWVSTFPFWGWTVLKVPEDQAAFAQLVASWMFGIGGASTLAATVMNAWRKRT